ncbi:hypothetical protein [Martelella soudanensis]|uniref:hypothetical protein n=1 Tax=unclassified Martelella TaxID=2629616 RepID=UPI0015DEF8B4|nr:MULTISPECIES: hypothetical protein [unclassified Martelella]
MAIFKEGITHVQTHLLASGAFSDNALVPFAQILVLVLLLAGGGVSRAEGADAGDLPVLQVSTLVDKSTELTLADILAGGDAIRFVPSPHDGIDAR